MNVAILATLLKDEGVKMDPGTRIGLFGGSFDPIHLGHLQIAAAAIQQASLDTLFFIPCRQSPHKASSTQANAEQRCRMIELAIAEMPEARLSRTELDREGPSFSWMTAEWFANEFPDAELFWIMGADQWNVLHTWSRADRLAELVTFLTFTRDGQVPAPREGYRMQALESVHPASATDVRESREAARNWLPASVLDYITEEKIYWNHLPATAEK